MALIPIKREPYELESEGPSPAPGPFAESPFAPNRGTTEPTASNPGTHVGPFSEPVAGSRFTADQWAGFRTQAQEAGAPEGWFDDFIKRNPDDPNRAAEAYALPTDHRPYDSQSTNPLHQQANAAADLRTRQPGQPGGPPATGTPRPAPAPGPFGASGGSGLTGSTSYAGGAFDDPAANFAEQYALERFGQRTNPPSGSGTALYESFAKEFSDLLKADPFTDQEESAMRVQAFDQLEQNKQSEMRAKQQELAQRRITNTSGVYLSEMNRIRDKWDKLKASNENQLLTTAIGERQRRLTQSFSVLASLAASEEGRMDAALALSLIPLQLQDQAFNRLVTATNLGGNSSQITNSLMQLLTVATNNQRYNEQQQAEAMAAIGEYLGGLLG